MRPILQRVWRAADETLSLPTVAARWRTLLGDDFDAAKSYLTPLGESDRFPCPSPAGRGCPRRIVERRGQLLAVCNDSPRLCDPIPVSREDVVLYDVRMDELAAIAARTLGLEPHVSTSRPGGEIWSLGALPLRPGSDLPAFFYSARHPGRFDRGVAHLLRGHAGPFLLVAARSLLSSPSQTAGLRRRKCILLAAEDVWYAADQGGRLVLANGDFRSEEEEADSSSRPGSERCELVRLGSRWRGRFAGKDAVFPHSRGLELIAILVQKPGQEIHADRLLAAADGRGAPLPGGSAGEVIDNRALAAYKNRLDEIAAEIEEARECGRDEEVERLLEERDELLGEMKTSTGLGGRKRKASDDADRSRKRARAAITRELQRLDGVLPELAEHLRESIRLGAFLSYAPKGEIAWLVG